MTIKRIVTDAHVEVDVNLGYYRPRDPEELARRLEQACRDFMDFVRDHRSQDIHDAYVVREYGYKCEHCGWITDKEPEEPGCCEQAIREWATPEKLIEFGYEEM